MSSTKKKQDPQEEPQRADSDSSDSATAQILEDIYNELFDSDPTTATDPADSADPAGADKLDLAKMVAAFVSAHRPKLMILTPTYGFSCNVDFVISLMNTLQLLQKFEVDVVVEFCKNDSLISRARNNLIAKALAHHLQPTASPPAPVTHVLFIDGDIVWNPWDVLKLLISGKELVGGIYPKKKYNFEKMLLPDFPRCLLDKKKGSFLNDMDDLTFLKCKLVDCNLNYLSEKIEIKNNLCEVRHIATGFMMIQCSLLEDLKQRFPEMKYEDDCGFLNEAEQTQAYAFFNTEVVDRHFLSEDWYFCELVRKAGKPVFADISINLCHVGHEYFNGSILASLI